MPATQRPLKKLRHTAPISSHDRCNGCNATESHDHPPDPGDAGRSGRASPLCSCERRLRGSLQVFAVECVSASSTLMVVLMDERQYGG